MKLMTLDLGTKTGWAKLEGDQLSGGTINFATKRHEGAGMRGYRFRQWLESLTKPDMVLFEEVRRHNSVAAGHAYGGFMVALTAWCEEFGVKYSSVPVGTIKKAATGNGSASKQMMISAAIQRWGVLPDDDNHADALGILTYAVDVLKV